MTSDAGHPDTTLSEALRRHRADHRLTLAQLADSTGISAAQLSRIENGKSVPTISVLLELSRAYGVSLGELVGEQERPGRIFFSRREDRRAHASRDALFTAMSSPSPDSKLQALSMSLAPDRLSTAVSHPGEEWIYVLSGRADVVVSGETHTLGPEDSMHFESSQQHYLANPYDIEAQLILVSTVSPVMHHREHGG